MDTPVTQLLEQILGELITIRQALISDEPAHQTIPVYPGTPLPILQDNSTRCARCGIHLSGSMGYACTDPSCPTGLGPITCTAGA